MLLIKRGRLKILIVGAFGLQIRKDGAKRKDGAPEACARKYLFTLVSGDLQSPELYYKDL